MATAARRSYDLWGVPFDGGSTLGRPGSRYAPDRVRHALRWISMRVEDGLTYSVDTDAMITVGDDLLADRGDVDVVGHDLAATADACAKAVMSSLQEGRSPIVVGGDDSLLFPCARGVHDALPGTVGVIHFDAHLDLMDHNRFQGRLSQSSGMRRTVELPRVSPRDCIQVGSRHFNFPASGRFKQETGLRHLSAAQFQAAGVQASVEQILDHVSSADHLFLSFDIDAIDPAFAPGSGADEPGGLTSQEALTAVRLLAPHCDAMALTEINPMADQRDATATLGAYLLYHFAVFGSVRA